MLIKGKLIINDNNVLNPYSYLKAKNEQRKKGGVSTTKTNPKTGEAVPYVQERLLSQLRLIGS